MNLGVTGASGFIGQRLLALAREAGHRVIAFSRGASIVRGCAETRAYHHDAPMDFRNCEGVIHLAGESVVGLWTDAKRQRIRESRVAGTRQVAQSILALESPPRVLVSASAIGFYGETGDRETDETAPVGEGFLAEVCRGWEESAAPVRARGVRLVHPRIGIVYGPGGGALRPIALAFKLGLGGRLGSGRQWISWIHRDDLCRLLLACLENETLRGPVNATAPNPVRNVEFTATLGRVVHRPAILPAPAFALRALLGEFSRELLDSKRILPAEALRAGFEFRFSQLEAALRDVLR